MGIGSDFSNFGFSEFGDHFASFQIIFSLVFVLVIGIFIVVAIKGIRQWNKNNHSPKLTVPATVVAKRTNISHYHSGAGVHHTTHSTSYYVTFQVESGDRIELYVAGHEYGLLIEGDQGRVTFQGTRYLGFERNL